MSDFISTIADTTDSGIPENWLAFVDLESGRQIHPDKFYAFPDYGGADFESFSMEETLRQTRIYLNTFEYDKRDFEDIVSTKSEDLGDYALVICSGRDFIKQLSNICCGSMLTLNNVYGWFITN